MRVAIITAREAPEYPDAHNIYLQIKDGRTVADMIRVARRMRVDEILIEGNAYLAEEKRRAK